MSLGITALTAALDYLAVTNGYGIMGVAWVTFSVYLLNGSLLFLFAMGSFYGGFPNTLAALGRKLAPLVVSVILALAIDRFVPKVPANETLLSMGRLVLMLGAFAGLYLAAVRPLARGLGLWQLLSEFRLPGLPGSQRNGEKRD